jgi:NAD(P)-dependent dehydrogenase (short-subunit alcohol dehydrogenase family)
MESLDGKRVIVTGGAGAIGNAAVGVFVKLGASVACTYNTETPDVPNAVILRRCDVSNKSEVDTTFDDLAAALVSGCRRRGLPAETNPQRHHNRVAT